MTTKSTLTPLLLLLITFATSAIPLSAAEISEEKLRGQFEANIKPFMGKNCNSCHGAEEPEAGFRTDNLDLSTDSSSAEKWQHILDALNLGDMPPENAKTHPSPAETQATIDWITNELERAQQALAEKRGEVVLKRLNRNEYDNTIQDLFHTSKTYSANFPNDILDKETGFNNIGHALVTSTAQLEAYLNAATRILTDVIVTHEKPQPWRSGNIPPRNGTKPSNNKRTGRTNRFHPEYKNAHLLTDSHRSYGEVPYEFKAPTPGTYRLSGTVYAIRNTDPIHLVVKYGKNKRGAIPKVADEFDLIDETPHIFTHDILIEKGDFIFLTPTNLRPDYLKPEEIPSFTGPAVAVESLTLEGPIETLADTWPPLGHQTIFASRDVNSLTDSDALSIISEFAPKAFRRPVSSAEIQPYRDIYTQASTSGGHPPLEALKIALSAILSSPDFIYLIEPAGELDHYAIASRLSYFLWNSMPDKELLSLAASGKLKDPATLDLQVERLLTNPKSERFIKNFLEYWINLREVGEMRPDPFLFPEYDEELERAMYGESIAFFREMIDSDLPIPTIIKSDFAMLNKRLAKHYGIEGVSGSQFQKISLPAKSIRGGIITQAAPLHVTATSVSTSPVVRGTWFLEKIMGTPAPAPPPNVPPIEPDIRGASTIKQQLEAHRSNPQCSACHAKIDPYGLALENFDVTGFWRDNYRAKKETTHRRALPGTIYYTDAKPVETNDRLPTGQSFTDFRQFRDIIYAQSEQLNRNMTSKLLTYATGRSMEFTDQPNIEAIVTEAEQTNLGLRTLIKKIVQSPIFTNQ